MVLGEALLGSAAGVNTLWHYNRSNYMYDRKMRQEQELKVLEWRKEQAALWREDIRDIIGLTEKKMDSYLIISVLQVEMCVALFTEGRLEPGTPPWLLHFYMLALGAAFMYLLMSTWLCMHASVVASCSSARLLTQFVRLPIPTWEQLQAMRTFGDTFEQKRVTEMLRVPFTGEVPLPVDETRVVDGKRPATVVEEDEEDDRTPAASALPSGTPAAALRGSASRPRGNGGPKPPEQTWADPWHSELPGADRDIYELMPQPAALRRHVQLAKRAAAQYQCYDAFARVSMTFGTNQLLHAVAYYALGYVCVQDGAVWGGLSVVAIMGGIAMALVHLDFSLTRLENWVAQVLIFMSFGCTGAATLWWNMEGLKAKQGLMIVLPCAYAAHGLWLLWALRACGLTRQSDGVVLPMRFRAVLYLDVFGWFYHGKGVNAKGAGKAGGGLGRGKTWVWGGEPTVSLASLAEEGSQVQAELNLWKSESVQRAMGTRDREYVNELAKKASEAEAEAAPKSSGVFPWQSSQASSSSSGNRVRFAPNEAPLVRLRGHDHDHDEEHGSPEEVVYFLDPESGQTFVDDGHVTETEMHRVHTIEDLNNRVDRFCKDAKQLSRAKRRREEGSGLLDKLDRAAKHYIGLDSDEDDNGVAVNADWQSASDAPPSGEVKAPPEEVFHPQTWAGAGDDGGSKDRSGCSNEIVTGHDQTHPGRLPAKVFRAATGLIIFLWALGLSVPFGVVRDFLVDPLQADVFVKALATEEEPGEAGAGGVDKVDVVVGTDPNGLPMLLPAGQQEEPPMLPDGIPVKVSWPMHAAFVPRSIACDHTGTTFVVSDDFMMYASVLQEKTPSPTGLLAQVAQPSLSFVFKRVPMCSSMEGEELEDIDIECEGAAATNCQAFALHKHSSMISSCPIIRFAGRVTTQAQAAAFVHPPRPWKLSQGWLKQDQTPPEIVKSFCVNSACNLQGLAGLGTPGCTVVGTSTGRILEMKKAMSDPRLLVPDRILHQRGQVSPRGALTILSNGVSLALQHATQQIEAFDVAHGRSLGVWSMPKGITWLMLCGAQGFFYSLGISHGKRVVIHRFQVPDKVRLVAPPVTPVRQEI